METSVIVPIALGLLSTVTAVAIAAFGFTLKYIFATIKDLKIDITAQLLKAEHDARQNVTDAKEDARALVSEAKADARNLARDEERRRTEAIGSVLAQVMLQYTDIKNEIHDLRDDIKEVQQNNA